MSHFTHPLDNILGVDVGVHVELLLCDGRQHGLHGLLRQAVSGAERRPSHQRVCDRGHPLERGRCGGYKLSRRRIDRRRLIGDWRGHQTCDGGHGDVGEHWGRIGRTRVTRVGQTSEDAVAEEAVGAGAASSEHWDGWHQVLTQGWSGLENCDAEKGEEIEPWLEMTGWKPTG